MCMARSALRAQFAEQELPVNKYLFLAVGASMRQEYVETQMTVQITRLPRPTMPTPVSACSCVIPPSKANKPHPTANNYATELC